jgi:hypothetical protein
MKGFQSEIITYICEADKDNLLDEKTTWHLRTMSVKDRLPITNSFAKAVKSDQFSGKTSFEEDRMWAAKRNEWLATVAKIENYQFGYKFSDLQAKGWIPVIEDQATIALVLEDLPVDVITELLDAANKLTASESMLKKKSK